MGYMRHHAIVVTGFQDEAVTAAHTAAVNAGCRVSPIVQSGTNGYTSFFVAPDGSKEGWPTSAEGDEQRLALIVWLRQAPLQGYYVSWAEMQYGDEDGVNIIKAHSGEKVEGDP